MFQNIIKELSIFNNNAWSYVAESIEDNADDIVYINQSRIIDKGTDSDNVKLRNKQASYRGYSPPYEKRKKKLGLYNGHINLYLSGEYLGAYDIKANENEVDVFVNPTNADLDEILKTLYGEKIQGLSEKEWAAVVNKFILPAIIDKFLRIFA